MSGTTYRLLQNSFEIQTAKSHKKAVSLSTDTTDKLRVAVNPYLVTVYNEYLAYHDAYIALNLAVEIAEGTYKGKTATFETIMGGVGEKLRLWEAPIRVVFPEDSGDEIEIFPQKRKPFYEGTYEMRLLAVKALRDKLLEYTVAHASLVPVQADVAAFFTLANTARQTQQGKEGIDGDLRAQRETQRVTTMNAYWGIAYGGLLHEFRNEPQRIAEYIDFSLLYDTGGNEPVIVNGGINAGQVINFNNLAPDLDATAETVIRLKNTSTVPLSLTFYSANNPTDLPGPGPQFTVASGETLEKVIGDFQLGTYPELNIHNPTGLNGTWEIVIEL